MKKALLYLSDRLADAAGAVHVLASGPRPQIPADDPAPDNSNLSLLTARNLVRLGERASNEGNHPGLNLALLLVWMGNTEDPRSPTRPMLSMEPSELNRALQQGRVHINIEPDESV